MDVADYAEFPAFDADPAARIWNLWAYIDARDGALAVRRALEYDARGLEAFIVACPDSVMSTPSADLLAEYFPDVPLRRPVSGTETLLASTRPAPAGLRPAPLVAIRGRRRLEPSPGLSTSGSAIDVSPLGRSIRSIRPLRTVAANPPPEKPHLPGTLDNAACARRLNCDGLQRGIR